MPALEIYLNEIIPILNLSPELRDPNKWKVSEFNDTPLGRAILSPEKVLKVDKTIKSSYPAFSPFVLLAHLKNTHPVLAALKFNFRHEEIIRRSAACPRNPEIYTQSEIPGYRGQAAVRRLPRY